jgi:hypothetical protein
MVDKFYDPSSFKGTSLSNDILRDTSFESEGGSSSGGGGTFTIANPPRTSSTLPYAPTPGTAPIEQIVRAFAQVSTRLPDPPRPDPAPLPGEDGEAFIEWGAASNFEVEEPPEKPIEDAKADDLVTDPGDADAGPTWTTAKAQKAKKKDKPQDQKPGIDSFDFMDATAQKGKVYHPDDAEIWIEVIRYTSIRFRGPKGRILKLNVKYPPFPEPPAS